MKKGPGTVRVLGIDPGSRVTGYGVVDSSGADVTYVDAGTIRSIRPKPTAGDAKNAGTNDMAVRLKRIFDGITEIVETWQPDVLAIEEVFIANNPRSALILGQARGAILCASAINSLPVSEYAAREIKLALVGKGSADKSQVSHMVRILLGLTKVPASDAADALACAICHCHSQRFGDRVEMSLGHRQVGGA